MISPRPKPQRTPHQKPERLPERNAVTIALGFKCHDGIAICSDSLVTQGNQFGFYKAKFHFIRYPDDADWVVMTMYSGYEDVMSRVNRSIEASLKLSVASISIAKVREVVEGVLEYEYKKHRPEISKLETLCAISVKGEKLELLRSKGKVVTDAQFECLGIGDSALLRFLYDIACPIQNSLNVQQALLWGIYMIQQAKKYVPQWCGGDTHAFKILEDGKVYPFIKPIEVEEMAAKLELTVSEIVWYFTNPSIDKFEFDRECEKLIYRLRLWRMQ